LRRRLGSSELEVFPLALGTNTFCWTASPEVSRQILDAYFEGGGNFIDTADSYSAWAEGNSGGESETVIGEWLAGRAREEVVVATKVSQHPEFLGLAGDNVAAAAEASLARLGTDYIDVYFAHFDDPETPLEETVAAFDRLVERGVVRHVGISNYTPARIESWLEIAARLGAAPPVVVQPHYNLLVREPFESELLPILQREGLGAIPYYPLAAGFLTGKYRSAADAEGSARNWMVDKYMTPAGFAVVDELVAIADDLGSTPSAVALAWLRQQPGVTAPIASASRPAQVADMLASAELELGEEQLARLARVSDAFDHTAADG